MGKIRIRKRRRRRFRKPNVAIFTLSFITVILLILLGGLYWQEASQNKLTASASDQVEDSQMLQEDNLPASDDDGAVKLVEGVGPDEMIVDSGEVSTNEANEVATSEESDPAQEGSKPVDGTVTNTATQAPMKPNQQGVTKTDSHNSISSGAQTQGNQKVQIPLKPDGSDPINQGMQSPMKPNELPSTKSDNTGTTNTSTPSSVQVDPAIAKAESYEQEFTELQGKCTRDMKSVLSDAESNLQQLDKSDPRNVLAWRDKTDSELSTSKSVCDSSFQSLLQKAENDSIPEKVVEDWNKKYDTLKMKLKEESEARLQQLLGG